MANIEDKLTAKLYRAFCPSPTELGEYHLGIASDEQAREIRQHLKTCPHCREELNQLKTYLNEVSPDLQYSPVEQIRVWMAKLIPPSQERTLAADFGVRGSAAQLRQYRAEDAELTIEVQDSPQQDGRKNLIGLLMGVETSGLQAHLWQEGQKVQQVEVDELGNFTFQHLQPGSYDLIMQGESLEIHVQNIQI